MRDAHIDVNCTGPRTPEGKRRSGRNATRHGIFAQIAIAGQPQESLREYKKLHKAFRKTIEPVGALEEILVELLTFEFLRLGRVYKADLRVAPLIFERLAKAVDDVEAGVQAIEIDRQTEVVLLRKELDPELVLRYGNTINRQIERLIFQIEHLQRIRLGRIVAPAISVQVTE